MRAACAQNKIAADAARKTTANFPLLDPMAGESDAPKYEPETVEKLLGKQLSALSRQALAKLKIAENNGLVEAKS